MAVSKLVTAFSVTIAVAAMGFYWYPRSEEPTPTTVEQGPQTVSRSSVKPGPSPRYEEIPYRHLESKSPAQIGEPFDADDAQASLAVRSDGLGLHFGEPLDADNPEITVAEHGDASRIDLDEPLDPDDSLASPRDGEPIDIGMWLDAGGNDDD